MLPTTPRTPPPSIKRYREDLDPTPPLSHKRLQLAPSADTKGAPSTHNPASEATPKMWGDYRHGQLVTIDLDGKQSTAAYAEQDNGLIFRRPGDRADALFSNGFGICVAVAIFGTREQGTMALAHTSQVDDKLHQLVAEYEEDFEDEMGHPPYRTCLVQFEDGLDICLKKEQEHDLEEFTTTFHKEAALGMTVLQDEDQPVTSKPPLLDAVAEGFRNIARTAASRSRCHFLSVKGRSILVDSARRLHAFPDQPPLIPATVKPDEASQGPGKD